MITKLTKSELDRFKWMGFAFIGLALFFGGGAYLFPATASEHFYDWAYLSPEEKEPFYMVSLIFFVAGLYCFRKNFT